MILEYILYKFYCFVEVELNIYFYCIKVYQNFVVHILLEHVLNILCLLCGLYNFFNVYNSNDDSLISNYNIIRVLLMCYTAKHTSLNRSNGVTDLRKPTHHGYL